MQEDLATIPGVTVLIHDQFCAAELRRARKRGRLMMPTKRIVINHRICEGCGDCGDVSNCLSVQPIDTPLGRKTAIDQASCNFDFSCLHGDCPAFMTVEIEPASATGATDTGTEAVTRSEGVVPDPVIDGDPEHVRLRLAGIGGTGVVTVAQILSTAAMFDGWNVRGLDQTGLSQKAGPVISDVVLSRHGHGSSNLVGRGDADLILGFDALVASSDASIASADPGRTAVVASTAHTPTGRMISHPDVPYPDGQIEARFAVATRAGHFVDSARLSATLTGSEAQANVFLLGVAVQAGLVPVSIGAIEGAIELNGVAVEANLAAFDWGRRWVHDPESVETIAEARDTSLGPPTITVPDLPDALERRMSAITGPGALRDVLGMLAADLVAYQNEAYAMRFVEAVAIAFDHERQVDATSTELTETVARSLHKLMAYKDEYEVARLLLLPEGEDAALAVGGPDAQSELAPPSPDAEGARHGLEDGAGKLVEAGVRRAAAWQAVARHPPRPVRTDRDAPHGGVAPRRIPHDDGDRLPIAHRRASRPRGRDRRAPRHDPRIREPEDPSHRRVPRAHRRRAGELRAQLTSGYGDRSDEGERSVEDLGCDRCVVVGQTRIRDQMGVGVVREELGLRNGAGQRGCVVEVTEPVPFRGVDLECDAVGPVVTERPQGNRGMAEHRSDRPGVRLGQILSRQHPE